MMPVSITPSVVIFGTAKLYDGNVVKHYNFFVEVLVLPPR